MAGSKRVRTFFARAGIALWVITASAVSADLLAGHLLTLPEPEQEDLARVIGELRRPGEANRWIAIHVLDATCPCSQNVFDHLVSTARPGAIAEKILLVGSDPDREQKARAGRFEIVHVAREHLAGVEGIQAVPLFVVADPEGRIRYSGGYTDRKQSPSIQDLEIMSSIARGERPDALPLFGCAVGEKLQRTLDPLSLKYSGRR